MPTRKFDDYLKELYARKPGLKLDVAIAGILIDVQIKYYERLKKTPANDAVGGFNKEVAAIKALITTAQTEAVEAFAAELKAEERIIGSGGGTLGVESADIDRLLAKRTHPESSKQEKE